MVSVAERMILREPPTEETANRRDEEGQIGTRKKGMPGPRRIAMACDDSAGTLDALSWALIEVATKDDTMVLVHVLKCSDRKESHEPRTSTDGRPGSKGTNGAIRVGNDDKNSEAPSPHRGNPHSSDGGNNLAPTTEREVARVAAGWLVLNKYAGMCREANIPSITVLTRGEPGAAFVDAAASHDCDLAVLGSRCLGPIKRAVFSSVSSHVLRDIHCPVIVYRKKHHSSTEKSSPSTKLNQGSTIIQPIVSPGGTTTLQEHFTTELITPDDSNNGYTTPPQSLSTPDSPISTPSGCLEKRKRRRIGVGVDGSKGCAAALSWTLKNIYRRGDIIVLINCQSLQFIPGAGYGSGTTFAALEEKAKESGKKLLRKYMQTCEKLGVKSAQIFARGDPGRELAEVAETHKCSVVVLGAHGSSHDKRNKQESVISNISTWLWKMSGGVVDENQSKLVDGGQLGSVSYAVAHAVHMPVVVVRRQQRS